MKFSEEDAVKIAQEFLETNNTGLSAGDHAAKFDGYYTLHTMKGEEISGMMSVNGFTSELWYHDWHGYFLGMEAADGHDD